MFVKSSMNSLYISYKTYVDLTGSMKKEGCLGIIDSELLHAERNSI